METFAKNVTDEKTSYDAACKRLLSERIILAWIWKIAWKNIVIVMWMRLPGNILRVYRR